MLVYSQLENFHENANFLSNYNKFCGLQNSNSFSQSLNYINKKSAKSIATYDVSTLYTKLPYDKLKSKYFY